MSKVTTPEVLWAQRSHESDAQKNYILLTISIPDCAPNPELQINATDIDLKAKSSADESVEYHLHIDLYKEITPEMTQHKIANGQHYFMKLYKKDLGVEYWPRLTKEKVKYGYIKTDFNKWVDEDEQEEAADVTEGMDMSNMFGAGGAGSAGGMDMNALQEMLAQQGNLPAED